MIPRVMVLHTPRLHDLIRGLAVAKVTAERTKIGFVDDWRFSWMWLGAPVAVSVQQAWTPEMFKGWVNDEQVALWGRFVEVCRRDPAEGLRWMEGAIQARDAFLRSYQEEIDGANRINQQIRDVLLTEIRATATIKMVAEISLTWMGVFVPASTLIVALEKFVICTGEAVLPGLIDDVITSHGEAIVVQAVNHGRARPTIFALTANFEGVTADLKEKIKLWHTQTYADLRRQTRSQRSGLTSGAKKALTRTARNGVNATTAGRNAAVRVGAQVVCYGLAAWSTWVSIDAWHTDWNQKGN